MRWLVVLVAVAIVGVSAAFAFMPPAAEGVICNPFASGPQVDMLPIGTRVTFDGKNGTVEAYYVQSAFAANCQTQPLAGLDTKAYVISFSDPLGTRVVLNRNRFNPQE